MRGKGKRTQVFASLFIGTTILFSDPNELKATEPEIVDAVLVLALDVSSSIRGEQDPVDRAAGKPHVNELELQRRGAAQAFRSREVLLRLLSCNPQGVGFTIVEWSGLRQVAQVNQIFQWRTLRTAEDLEVVANFLETRTERSYSNSTDIASALRESARLLAEAPYMSARQIISLSSDGDQALMRGNDTFEATVLNEHLFETREQVVAQGVSINGIALLTSHSDFRTTKDVPLDVYFDQFVVGGPGSFVLGANSFEEYGRALEESLVRELTNCAM